MSSIQLVLNHFMQVPQDPDSSATDELCTEQPQHLMEKGSAKPSVHQLENEIAEASGGAPDSAQCMKKEPDTPEGADYTTEGSASVPREVGVIGQ